MSRIAQAALVPLDGEWFLDTISQTLCERHFGYA